MHRPYEVRKGSQPPGRKSVVEPLESCRRIFFWRVILPMRVSLTRGFSGTDGEEKLIIIAAVKGQIKSAAAVCP